MTLTPSCMIPLGTKAPPFKLKDVVSGKMMSLSELKSDKATVIIFISNHCPFVRHILKNFVAVAKAYIPQGISFIAISSSDIVAYPEDSPENMKKFAEKFDFPFPYFFDETQNVAHAYEGACTPDIFVFDRDLKCVYRGQFDDSRPMNTLPITGKDLKHALECILKGFPVPKSQKPSIGCNIKWKGGD